MTWTSRLRAGEALAELAKIPDDTVDAIITDPPYSSGGAFRADRADRAAVSKYVHGGTQMYRPDFAGDNRDQRGYAYWTALWLAEALRATRSGGICCVFADWRQLPTTTDAIQAGGWVWRGIVCWDKTEIVRPRLGGFASQCEYVVWGTKGPLDATKNPVTLPGVIRVPGPRGEAKQHIAEKPVGLLRVLVEAAPPGGLVLDPFCGSGSTGVACAQTARRFYGIDYDRAYIETARDRITDCYGRPDLWLAMDETVGVQTSLLEPMADGDGYDIAAIEDVTPVGGVL